MLHCSILIPQQDAADEVSRLVPELDQFMRRRGWLHEVLCIDDGSCDRDWQRLLRLRAEHTSLRLLRMEGQCGLSAALAAGIQAARGEQVILFEASGQYRVDQIALLVERLARADLVVGRRHTTRFQKWLLALAQTPRRWLLGLEVRDPDCLFWAARREALAGIELLPGMHRFLGSLVTTRGYRVTEVHVDHQSSAAYRVGSEAWPRPDNLLATWWQRRNWRNAQASEADERTAIVAMGPPASESSTNSGTAGGKAAA
jgi:glycosyltransferase involved in cell wall biosynthesis